MKANFKKTIEYIFSEEGGFVDDPRDPGGATNMGITLNTLSAWRRHRVSPQDVRELTETEASKIYQQQFWNKIDGDNLPSGVDYAVFDFAVNSGPGRAAKTLQATVNQHEDGVIGAQTIEAISARSPVEVINALCDARASWLKGLSTASTFGKGWLARVERVRSRALAMALTLPFVEPMELKIQGLPKARQQDTAVTTALKHPPALSALASVTSGLAAIVSDHHFVRYALAIMMIGFCIIGLWHLVQRVRGEP